jgi:arylformamidase
MRAARPTAAPATGADRAPDLQPGTLDHEYYTRAWASNYQETLERHKRKGEAARALPGALLAIPWGARPRQRLDLLLPDSDRGPLALYLHGGFWQYRTSGKEGGTFLAPAYLARGIAFAAVSYELCPDVTMDGMVEQIREAVLWLLRRAPGLGYDIERLTVVGHSAGAHLGAMMALTDWEKRGAPRNLVAGVCGVSGMYDLRPLARTLFNAALGMDEACAVRNSPLDHLRRGAPPMLLAVGARESGEFKRQTRDFAAACRALGVPTETFELAGRDQYTAIEDVIEPRHPLHAAAMTLAIGERRR